VPETRHASLASLGGLSLLLFSPPEIIFADKLPIKNTNETILLSSFAWPHSAGRGGHGSAQSSINGSLTTARTTGDLTSWARRTGNLVTEAAEEHQLPGCQHGRWSGISSLTYLNPNSPAAARAGAVRVNYEFFVEQRQYRWPALRGTRAVEDTAGRPRAGGRRGLFLYCACQPPASRCWMFLWMSISGSGSSPQN